MKPFITTFTGRKVNPLDLQPEDICIMDIAHHLANINRFGGAVKRPVSVAQHSVYVSRLVSDSGWEREALFHDASEAYLGDVTKWLKRSPAMRGYREAEDDAWEVICYALGIRSAGAPQFNDKVEEADRLMVRFETLRVGAKDCAMFELPTHPRPTKSEIERVGAWAPWTWQASKRGFLDHARLLGFEV